MGGYGVLINRGRGTNPLASGGVEYELEAAPASLRLGGREVSTWEYNGGLPGPEIRIKEGQTLRATVLNRLPEDTTIHWHGVPLPNGMDGVPDVTQPGIKRARASPTSSWPQTPAATSTTATTSCSSTAVCTGP